MVTIKELKEICKKNNVKLLPHWNKEQIIFELYIKTGIRLEKTEEEERKDEKDYIKFLSHDTQYFSRDEYIELHGLKYVEEIEDKYKIYLNFNYYSNNSDDF
jgi:hypothetical protein